MNPNPSTSGLSPDEFRLLTDSRTAALVEKHLADDPVRLALGLTCERDRALMICRQVKYLQRARTKLPSYYAARCILPPLSYEQCSSEAAAQAKDYSGKLCVDLTCGLGVDSFRFSKSFDRVVSVERDPVLSEAARHNFGLLGVENVTVVNDTAEHFLQAWSGPKADLIYVDPARRSGGERVFLPEDCSPCVPELLPSLLRHAERVLIKLSPLFDVEEALRVFGGAVSKAEIVSVGGEVKELLVELTENPARAEISIFVDSTGRYSFSPEDWRSDGEETRFDFPGYGYLLVPDAAFYKGRLAEALFRRYFPDRRVVVPSKNGFAFAGEWLHGFPGRVYRIVRTDEYHPKRLKKNLKERGVGRINLLRRDFPHRSEAIKRSLGVGEGGTDWFAFTEIGGRALVLQVEPVGGEQRSAGPILAKPDELSSGQ